MEYEDYVISRLNSYCDNLKIEEVKSGIPDSDKVDIFCVDLSESNISDYFEPSWYENK